MKPFVNIVDEIIGDLNSKKTNGRTFGEEFQLESIPLWWFYRRFLTSHVLPKQFNTVQLVEGKKVAMWQRPYYRLIQFVFQQYFKYNEKLKLRSVNRNKTTKSLQKKVLFLTYTNHFNQKTGEVYRINSIVKKLEQDKKLKPLTLFVDPLSQRSYTQLKNLENTIYQYIEKEELERANQIAQELHQKWASLDKNQIFGRQWKGLRYTLNFFFSPEFIHNIALYYLAMKRVLVEESIHCVTLTSRNGFFEKCIIAAASKLNIPVIVVQHGMGMGTSDPELFPGMKIAVFGEAYQEKLLQWNMDEKDVVITGPIIFEDIHQHIQKKQVQTGKILVITDQYVEENYISKEEYFAKMRILLRQLHSLGKEIIVKLHPVEKYFTEYVAIVEKEGWKNVMVTQEHGSAVLYRLINDSDLVVNSYSTVALEAMILGKPILTINIGPSLVPNIEDSIFAGGIHALLQDDLAKAAAEALHDSAFWKAKRNKIVKKYCYKIDGKAVQRLVDVMYNIKSEDQ